MPNYINPRVTYFHRNLFANAGLADPYQAGDDWTWQSMQEAARLLTRDISGDGEIDVFGLESASSMAWQQFIHQAGGSEFNAVLFPTESQFNTEPVRLATEFAHSLIVEGRVVGGSLTSGTAAMSTTVSAQVKDVLNAADYDWDMAMHARGPYSRASIFGIGGIQMSTESADKDLAWRWIEFLTLNDDSVREYVRTNQRIPPLVRIQLEYAELVPDLSHNWMALAEAAAQPNSATLSVVTKNTGRINDAINQNMNRVWAGEMPPQTALATIHELVTALLSE